MPPPRSTAKHRLLRALRVSALSSLLLLPGCNILGPGLFLLSDDRTPSVHKLDPKLKTVVFIDDRNSVLPSKAARRAIAEACEHQILSSKLVETDLISSESLLPVVASERFSKPMSIAEIGRAVGAEQIVYATVDSFSLTPDGVTFAPYAKLRVKVIDAVNDKRLFPPETDSSATAGKEPYFIIEVPERPRGTALPKTITERTREEQNLAQDIGLRLSELFYKHSSRNPYSRVGQS